MSQGDATDKGIAAVEHAFGRVVESWRQTRAFNVWMYFLALPLFVGLVPWMMEPLWIRFKDEGSFSSPFMAGLTSGRASDIIFRFLSAVFVLTHQGDRDAFWIGASWAVGVAAAGNAVFVAYLAAVAAGMFPPAGVPAVGTPADAEGDSTHEGSDEDASRDEAEQDVSAVIDESNEAADDSEGDVGVHDDNHDIEVHLLRYTPSKDYTATKKIRAGVAFGGDEGGSLVGRQDLLIAGILTIAAAAVRGYALGSPNTTLFDEVHFGKFINHHFAGTYYFDIHPPFAKLIMWGLVKTLSSYDGSQPFAKIGEEYSPETPVALLRFWPCLMGTLLVPVVYGIARGLKMGRAAATLVGSMVLLDLLFVGESRMILTDSTMVFFFASSILCLLAQERTVLHSRAWFATTICLGTCMACCVAVKWTGLSVVAFVGIATVLDLARRARAQPDPVNEGYDVAVRLVLLIGIPLVVYVSCYGIFFRQLYKDGPGAAFMLPNFQSSLEGNKKEGDFPPPSFVDAFIYLTSEMFRANKDVSKGHSYSSFWYTWPFMTRPINCWQAKATVGLTSRVYLMGNPAVWWTSTVGVALTPFYALYVAYRSRSARRQSQTKTGLSSRTGAAGAILPYDAPRGWAVPGRLFMLLAGYTLSILPYALVQRACFLYHYMPAYIFAILATGTIFDGLVSSRSRRAASAVVPSDNGGRDGRQDGEKRAPEGADVEANEGVDGVRAWACAVALIVVFAVAFAYWAPVVYGWPMRSDSYEKRLWMPTWR